MKLGECDDTIYEGLKYAEKKYKKRMVELLKSFTAKDLENPATVDTIIDKVNRLDFERKSERRHFEDLKN